LINAAGNEDPLLSEAAQEQTKLENDVVTGFRDAVVLDDIVAPNHDNVIRRENDDAEIRVLRLLEKGIKRCMRRLEDVAIAPDFRQTGSIEKIVQSASSLDLRT
jgi:hypothetical protein